jgi:succinoglycan biosynthesis transport protein ExoP
MSKYFDQIVRSGASAALPPAEVPKFPALIERKSAVAPVAASLATPVKPVMDLRKSRLNGCRKIQIEESAFLRNRFRNADSLEAAEEAYHALRTRLLGLKSSQGLRSVQLTSATPGEGKTMTAFNLAVCCARLQEMSILLVDADIRGKGLTRTLELLPSPGLAEILCGQAEPEKAILAASIPSLYVLPSGESDVPLPELFADQRWQKFMGWCHEAFKLIIVDSPPVLCFSDNQLISASCDGVLMVVRAQQAKRDLLEKSAREVDARKLLGLVYNAV